MMNKSKSFHFWPLAVILLALIIMAGGVVIFINVRNSPGIEITFAPAKAVEGQIYISGEVNNPGLYPVLSGDALEDVIQAAGGFKEGADAAMIELCVVPAENGAQKIDINRAESWLLEALPGVGEAKAQAVIAYREAHGFFHTPAELLNVPGFSEGILSKIEDLVTVYD